MRSGAALRTICHGDYEANGKVDPGFETNGNVGPGFAFCCNAEILSVARMGTVPVIGASRSVADGTWICTTGSSTYRHRVGCCGWDSGGGLTRARVPSARSRASSRRWSHAWLRALALGVVCESTCVTTLAFALLEPIEALARAFGYLTSSCAAFVVVALGLGCCALPAAPTLGWGSMQLLDVGLELFRNRFKGLCYLFRGRGGGLLQLLDLLTKLTEGGVELLGMIVGPGPNLGFWALHAVALSMESTTRLALFVSTLWEQPLRICCHDSGASLLLQSRITTPPGLGHGAERGVHDVRHVSISRNAFAFQHLREDLANLRPIRLRVVDRIGDDAIGLQPLPTFDYVPYLCVANHLHEREIQNHVGGDIAILSSESCHLCLEIDLKLLQAAMMSVRK